jgi:hypothetical protein
MDTMRAHPFYTVVRAVEEAHFPGSIRHKETRLGFALEYLVFKDEFWKNEKTFMHDYIII